MEPAPHAVKLAEFIAEVRLRTDRRLTDQEVARAIYAACTSALRLGPKGHWTDQIVQLAVEHLRSNANSINNLDGS